ncbi:MAG: hypothetical protein MJE68_29460, partial [Proteobacteria bacterium]|nr:hypothetical protein [Pseudomonadota bacterium]
FPLATESESDVDVRLISITASLLVFSVLMFITGFLMGSLLIKHVMKSSKQEAMPGPGHGSVSLYEEITQPPSNSALSNGEVIKIEDNEAYGCI